MTLEARRPLGQWLETVVLTLIAVAIACAARPSDPFMLRTDFPWLLFAPVLLALRYGALCGLASAGVLAALWALGRQAGVVTGDAPTVHLTGALILTLICGEFAGLWDARLDRAQGALRYARERLDRLTRQHYLLLASHRRLEQEHFERPMTLRSALARIGHLAREPAAPGELPGAQALLALLTEFCQLEAASLHVCREGAPGQEPLAVVGTPGGLDAADPMVRHCLENNAIAHVQSGELRGADSPRYLVVAPMLSSEGRLHALLAVEQMPFLALHDETLSMLAVLLGYYADLLGVSRAATVMQRALPECPIGFADELVRVHRLRVEHGVPSSLLLLRFGTHADSADFAAFLRRQVRELDLVWELPRSANTRLALLVLVPLADEAAAEETLERLERALEMRYRVGFDAAGMRAHASQIGSRDPFVELKLFLDLHDVLV
ncbi:MAG TPA: PelD GGDEF domain-containing protein [Burkholderiales bacterium]|nr:PelD GGDEF domain-containing protein [Burkholderiales bacterium]